MKNFKFSTKVLALAMTGMILISGCSNNVLNDSVSTEKNNQKIESTIPSETTTSQITTTTDNKEESIIDFDTENQKENSNDNIVLEEVKNLKDDIEKILKSETVTDFKEECKDVFVTLVDFIFYDGEIKGITFDELSDEAKQELLKEVTIIDNLIMKAFPNYKEEISNTASSAYNKASELIKKGSENIKDFAKDKLGEENYNKIKDFKDKIKDSAGEVWEDTKNDASDLYDKAKDKIKNWYENFRK